MACPCEHCEELLQPYLDRALTDEERATAELHLEGCPSCRKAYRFEETLRTYVRKSCSEPMPVELKAKLASLRTPL
jgi:mycothiol system anti-sigma-R factor